MAVCSPDVLGGLLAEQEANNKSMANWALQLHDTLSASIEQELEVVHTDFNQFASLQAVLNKAQTNLIDINNNLATSPENRLPALMKQGLEDLFIEPWHDTPNYHGTVPVAHCTAVGVWNPTARRMPAQILENLACLRLLLVYHLSEIAL